MSEPFPLLHDPPDQGNGEKWYFRIPILGWMGAYQRQLRIEAELVDQAVDRGPVPESAWAPYTYDEATRRTIEEIVIRCAYPKGSTFHPLDPVELMFVLRYGDLNEVEILMAIEEELGFVVEDSLATRLIAERTTFIEFIRMVEEQVK